MADELKTPLRLEVAKSLRDAKRAERAVEKFGRKGQQAGKDTAEGMDGASGALARFSNGLLGLAGGMAIIEGIRRGVAGIQRAFEEADRARAQFARAGAGMMGQVAGMGRQFGLPEAQAVMLASDIAQFAGAPPTALGPISGMVTAMASAQAFPTAAIGAGKGGQYQAPPGLVPSLGQVARFAESRGLQDRAALGRMVAFALAGRPMTTENVNRILQQLHLSYRESGISEWGPFFGGAVGGIMPQLKTGVSFEQAMSEYAAMAGTMRDMPRSAGEQSRLVYEQLLQADRPEIVRMVGADTYWRLKKTDPDQLKAMVMETLLAPEGRARAALFQRLKIQPELGGRIAALGMTRGRQQEIQQLMQGASAQAMGGELREWRRGGRPLLGAGETRAALFGADLTPEQAEIAALRTLRDAWWKRYIVDRPILGRVRQFMSGEYEETGIFGRLYAKKEGEQLYGTEPSAATDWTLGLTGGRATMMSPGAMEVLGMDEYLERFPKMAPILRPGMTGGGTTINNPGIVYLNTPHELADSPDPRSGGILP